MFIQGVSRCLLTGWRHPFTHRHTAAAAAAAAAAVRKTNAGRQVVTCTTGVVGVGGEVEEVLVTCITGLGVLRRTGFVRRNRFLVLVLRAPKLRTAPATVGGLAQRGARLGSPQAVQPSGCGHRPQAQSVYWRSEACTHSLTQGLSVVNYYWAVDSKLLPLLCCCATPQRQVGQ
jgi:hypothetical protein